MTKISTLRVQLKKALDNDITDATIMAQVNDQILDLEIADSLMWKWMHEYQRPDYQEGVDIVRVYLEGEKEEISAVKDKMLTSIEDAQSILEQISNDD